MKLLKKVEIPYKNKTVALWQSEYNGKKMRCASVREALLYAWGFGADQAAELRYKMSMLNREKV